MRLVIFIFILFFTNQKTTAQVKFTYNISFPQLSDSTYHIKTTINGLPNKPIVLKLPNWMPGYYQIMHYHRNIFNLSAKANGKKIPLEHIDSISWLMNASAIKVEIDFDVKTKRKFVANSFVNESHAYLAPGNSFLYIETRDKISLEVQIIKPKNWNIATGLTAKANNIFTADSFDELYDCPILLGPLDSIPSFAVKNIPHRFVGYKIGDFDKQQFSNDLQKIVKSASNIIGDIPYKNYSFIAIGPGNGGIEHLNNTTISFSGESLNTAEGKARMYSFLAHEYFHHYNVKRIRPVELGPFDYQNGNRTTQLWISEGLTVYYEYLIVKRAGIVNNETLFKYFENNINQYENDEGRRFQSIVEASYQTWEDGPFGKSKIGDSSISYYEKGPLIGLLLDFEIRHSTQNKKSLDDVMRKLYFKFYKELHRGFTDAEFREACEEVAGKNLSGFFRYIYNTETLDYNKYLGYAGLTLLEEVENGKRKFKIKKIEQPNFFQQSIFNSWAAE